MNLHVRTHRRVPMNLLGQTNQPGPMNQLVQTNRRVYLVPMLHHGRTSPLDRNRHVRTNHHEPTSRQTFHARMPLLARRSKTSGNGKPNLIVRNRSGLNHKMLRARMPRNDPRIRRPRVVKTYPDLSTRWSGRLRLRNNDHKSIRAKPTSFAPGSNPARSSGQRNKSASHNRSSGSRNRKDSNSNVRTPRGLTTIRRTTVPIRTRTVPIGTSKPSSLTCNYVGTFPDQPGTKVPGFFVDVCFAARRTTTIAPLKLSPDPADHSLEAQYVHPCPGSQSR